MTSMVMGIIGLAAGGASIGATLAGGEVAAQGAEYTAQANANMYNYQAQVATLNKGIAQQNAAFDIESGEVLAEESGIATGQQIGQTLAQQGAGNIDVRSGSAKLVRRSEAETGAENEALIRSQAAKAAFGEEVQAYQYQAQSQLDTTAAGYALQSGQYQASASILGATASAASKFSSLAMSAGNMFGGSGGGGGGGGGGGSGSESDFAFG